MVKGTAVLPQEATAAADLADRTWKDAMSQLECAIDRLVSPGQVSGTRLLLLQESHQSRVVKLLLSQNLSDLGKWRVADPRLPASAPG